MAGGAHTEVEGGFSGKSEKIKQEDDIPAIDDKWLRDWSESTDVKVDLSATKVEKYEIEEHEYGKKVYEQSYKCTPGVIELVKAQPTNVTTHQRIVGKDIDKLLKALCQDAKVSQRVGNLCQFNRGECWEFMCKRGQSVPENCA